MKTWNKKCSNKAECNNGTPLKVTNQTDPSIKKENWDIDLKTCVWSFCHYLDNKICLNLNYNNAARPFICEVLNNSTNINKPLTYTHWTQERRRNMTLEINPDPGLDYSRKCVEATHVNRLKGWHFIRMGKTLSCYAWAQSNS
jgi:hypothetical protein